ncbi:META domain-containing protein [Methyloprofundus sedimenti]|nr:META domain-containing protein [Methyloprofundus sedimenti]
MNSPTQNTAAEQLIEPPDIRYASVAPDKDIQEGQRMQNPLKENQWQLQSYLSEQGMQSALADTQASIEFSERKVSGSTGCNRYFADYQLIGDDTLKISQTGLTMMICVEAIAAQEQQFLKNLAEINFYLFQDQQLRLLDADREVRLVFKMLPALTLEQTAWQMTGINNGTGNVVSSTQTGKANLQFIDGKLQGSSGCNALTASYQINGSELSIGPVISTRKFCAENGLMIQEQRLLQALTQVSRYEIRAQQLRLVDVNGSLMLSLKQK